MVIPASKGGHLIAAALSGGGWLCTTCRCRSATRRKLATTRCGGPRTKSQFRANHSADVVPGSTDRRHWLIESGTVQWCGTCGCFAESRNTRRMSAACPGPPPRGGTQGGVRQQLMKLRAGVHPVTGRRLPMAIDSDGSALQGEGRYMRLHARTALNDTFAQYVPEELPLPKPSLGQSAHMKRQLMLERIRSKARKKDVLLELQDLIRTFVEEVGAESHVSGVEVDMDSDDRSDEEFWAHLPTADSRVDHIASIPVASERPFPGKMVSSRSRRLMDSRVAG